MDVKLNMKTPFTSVKAAAQADFVQRLGDGIRNLQPREWAEASWAFFVSDREK